MNILNCLTVCLATCASIIFSNADAHPIDERIKITLFSQAVEGNNAAFSGQLNGKGQPSPGTIFIQSTDLYLDRERKGSPVGTSHVACIQMIDPYETLCSSTFKFKDGFILQKAGTIAKNSSINVQGYYSEREELTPPCKPSVNYLSVSGGTGDVFQGVQGQLLIIHAPENPDVNNSCGHTNHSFEFVFSLLPRADAGRFSTSSRPIP